MKRVIPAPFSFGTLSRFLSHLLFLFKITATLLKVEPDRSQPFTRLEVSFCAKAGAWIEELCPLGRAQTEAQCTKDRLSPFIIIIIIICPLIFEKVDKESKTRGRWECEKSGRRREEGEGRGRMSGGPLRVRWRGSDSCPLR